MEYDPKQVLEFEYVNHAGVDRTRRVVPQRLSYEAILPHYPEPCWLLHAKDLDKDGAYRSFAMVKMRNVRDASKPVRWEDIPDTNPTKAAMLSEGDPE